MLLLTGDTSVWRMVVLILILVVALALTAGGHDLVTALLLSTVDFVEHPTSPTPPSAPPWTPPH